MADSSRHTPRPLEHRALKVVRDRLAEPDAATPADALTRAVRMETTWGAATRRLVDRVGGVGELATLDAVAHPDEPFDWSAVEEVDRSKVTEVLDLTDAVCDRWLDVEFRTVTRRLLARIARTDPRPIRRSSRPARLATGLVHAVLAGNGELTGGRRGGLRAGDVSAWFGTGPAGDVANGLVGAAAFAVVFGDEYWGWRRGIELPSPDVLHSRMRGRLVEEREMIIRNFLEEEQRRAGRRPLVRLEDGRRVEAKATIVDVALVGKGATHSGRIMMLLALATVEPDPELDVFALSVPEAYRLQAELERALAAPAPSR